MDIEMAVAGRLLALVGIGLGRLTHLRWSNRTRFFRLRSGKLVEDQTQIYEAAVKRAEWWPEEVRGMTRKAEEEVKWMKE